MATFSYRPFLFLLCFVVLIVSCVPDASKNSTVVQQSIESADFKRIKNLQNQGQTDSLISLLSSSDPTQRYLSALAFASHHDTKALDSLYSLLDDRSVKVRSIAAYAIGQIGNPDSEQSLIKGFRQKDTMSVDNPANAEVLNALGKISTLQTAKFIASADGYRAIDSALIVGQMKSLYQFAYRGIHDTEITQKVVDIVRDKSVTDMARLYAAHYLARPKNLDIEKVKFQIAEAFVTETNTNVKMALASALKHTNDPEIFTTLITQLELDIDYRIKCNIIRSLSSYDGVTTVPIIVELLKSDNIHIARTAAEYVRQVGDPKDAYKYRDVAKDSISPLVKADIYTAVMASLPHYYSKTKNATRWQIQQALAKDSLTYNIIGYLGALGQDPENLDFIKDYIEKTEDTRIQTAGISAMGTALAHKDFNAIYQTLSRSTRRKMLAYLQEVILTNDEGLVGAACNIIADPNAGLKEFVDSTNFLLEAKNKLKVPGQIESIHAIEKALAHIRGVNQPNYTRWNETKEIKWNALPEYNNVKAIVKTTKGNFTIAFYLTEAPGSVTNFIDLANQNYYDNKVFHRVVPNFVIQTGSPRGDNYGGADYTIRSELGPLAYDDEGYVGMASAGIHTESTQWFVTHSPTPHLDGDYTIFGKVVEGMDVVHNIQVGDAITDIIVSNL